MRTMPGLGKTPAATGIDLVFDGSDPEGRIVGLS
jgi:formyltetrahydrofolate synthetase